MDDPRLSMFFCPQNLYQFEDNEIRYNEVK